jgi:hypothetical protein
MNWLLRNTPPEIVPPDDEAGNRASALKTPAIYPHAVYFFHLHDVHDWREPRLLHSPAVAITK